MKRLIILMAMLLCVTPLASANYYGNYTNMTFNISATMGTQTAYQIKFILSNYTGASGYDSTIGNVIYTNGTTRADWADVAYLDTNGVAKPFWIENNTQTAHNVTAWVLPDSIAVDNSSKGSWGYGNASQTISTMDGLNTFPDGWDDFLEATYNTTKWTKSASLTWSQTGGIATSSTTTTNQGLYLSSGKFGVNYSAVSRAKMGDTTDGHYPGVGWDDRASGGTKYATTTKGDSTKWTLYWYDSSGGSSSYGTSDSTTYHIMDTFRNGTFSVISKVDTSTASTATGFPTATMYVGLDNYAAATTSSATYDWFFIRKHVSIEPYTSGYTKGLLPVTPELSASFTSSPNPQTVGFPVTFTDTSTGNPTVWRWTFGDLDAGNTSTQQNPTRTYTTPGNYTVWLNATNASGIYSNYSHFQLINDLGVGYVDEFTPIPPSSIASKVVIDPKQMDYSPASGKAITTINLDVPLGATGSFNVYQANGNVVPGSFRYTGYPLSTLIVTIGSGAAQSSYTEIMTQPGIPMHMIIKIQASANGTQRGISATYGWGLGVQQITGHTITTVTQASPMTRFTYTSTEDIVVTPYTEDFIESLKNFVQGYSDGVNDIFSNVNSWIDKLKKYIPMAWDVFSQGWYWFQFLFIDNIALVFVLWLTGTLAYRTLTARNVFVALGRWFKDQRNMFEFVYNGFNTLIQLIVTIIRAIIPLK